MQLDDQATIGAPAVAAGQGHVHVGRVAGASAILRLRAESPLVLLAPRPSGPAAWVVTGSLGGGLVRGDRLRLAVTVDDDARLCLTSQASTKVYRGRAAGSEDTVSPSSMELEATVGGRGLLALVPAPVTCFEDAAYTQRVAVRLGRDASLVLLDTITAGRSARGERWSAHHLASALVVDDAGGRLVTERLVLDPSDGPLVARLGRFDAIATLLLLGPGCAHLAARAIEDLARAPVEPGADVVEVASPIRGGALVRIAATSVERATAAARRHLGGLDALVGAEVLARGS